MPCPHITRGFNSTLKKSWKIGIWMGLLFVAESIACAQNSPGTVRLRQSKPPQQPEKEFNAGICDRDIS